MSHACVGTACMQIWSTAEGGGALTTQWDFTRKVDDSAATLCAPDNSECVYTTIDPGFMAPTEDVPGDSYYRLVDGTAVTIEIVEIDDGLTLKVNDKKLRAPMDSAHLGTMPTIHTHPTWLLDVPGDQFKDYHISYQLKTDSPRYTDSEVFTQIVTNVPPVSEGTPTPSPSPTPTGFRQPCNGDCDGDAKVGAAELVQGMAALATQIRGLCLDLDANRDGVLDDGEILASTQSLFEGCGAARPATLAEVQGSVFTPTCAIPTCHDATSHNAALVLNPDAAFDQLVGVEPDTFAARSAGLLRVDPGNVANSFLVIKLEGPTSSQGSQMPLTGSISPDDVQLIRDWIERGALP